MAAGRVHKRPPGPRPVSTLAAALWEEYSTIHGEPRVESGAHGPQSALDAYYRAASEKNQTALCLSGGGIRSAAFSLGVVQGLARSGLLARFDYLSTVSGGGYIGGWLSMMLHLRKGDAAALQAVLAGREAPPELQRLRNYTNYLTPSPGIASRDTWAGITLWVRNLLLNWFVFFPALFAAALLPILYVGLIKEIGVAYSWPLLLVALLCLGIGVFNGARHMPSHNYSAGGTGSRDNFVPLFVVVPLLVWAFLVPLVAAPWLRAAMPAGAIVGDIIPWLSFVMLEVAYVAAAFAMKGGDRRVFWRNLGWWTLAALAATAVLWAGLAFGIAEDSKYIAVLGPLIVTVAHLVQSLVYVALRTEAFRGELDREWLARLNAEKVVPALIWAIFAAICLVVPPLVFDGGWHSIVTGLVALTTGPASALFGKYSPAKPSQPGVPGARIALSLNVLADLAATIFAVALFAILAHAGQRLTGGGVVGTLVLIVIAGWLAWWFGRHINVNRFSLHAVYRNRLVRAFLGTARPDRTPDPFTGFDPRDNPRMVDLGDVAVSPRKLFPVVNVTLNVSEGARNAWSERKGESFTITPTACGAAYLLRREDANAGYEARGAYVRTSAYAGSERETGPNDVPRGISLGTAIALSGAAVSPNMGYHTSPATAFLMTLFNVRLGAWLPNPAIAKTGHLSRAKPPNALLTLLRELAGLSSDRGRAIYLSDGGHFENLGLYEMVRRRCRHIVVVDAGADPDSNFEDLGNAVHKIRIDQDVEVNFHPTLKIGSRQDPLEPFYWYAHAKISYPEGATGELIYIKPSDLRDMPMDVRAYRNANDSFPHQPTYDQFFGESQFESYRQLGFSEMQELADKAESFADLFMLVKTKLAPPGP
jgi:predicted acylesterase/phospholipase RssA